MAETPSEAWEHWQEDVDYVPEGGESLAAARRAGPRRRARSSAASAADADVVVVTHVSPIKSAVAWALGRDDRHLLAIAPVAGVDLPDRDAPPRPGADGVQRDGAGTGLTADTRSAAVARPTQSAMAIV